MPPAWFPLGCKASRVARLLNRILTMSTLSLTLYVKNVSYRTMLSHSLYFSYILIIIHYTFSYCFHTRSIIIFINSFTAFDTDIRTCHTSTAKRCSSLISLVYMFKNFFLLVFFALTVSMKEY